MQLSEVERWILSNQYRILERLYPEYEDSFKEAQEAIGCGYELEYDGLSQHIYSGQQVMTTVECQEVINILAMFSVLARTYKSLPNTADTDESSIRFPGFDENTEGKQIRYARYFCRSGSGNFTDLDRPDDFNSHMPTLDSYRRMLAAWSATESKYKLSKDDIIRIASARRAE